MRAIGEVPGDFGGRETGAVLGNGRYPSEARRGGAIHLAGGSTREHSIADAEGVPRSCLSGDHCLLRDGQLLAEAGLR